MAFCGDTNIILNDNSSWNLTSVNYPGLNPYQPVYTCNWLVSVPTGRQVHVEFLDVQVFPLFDIFSLNGKIFLETPSEDYISDAEQLEIVYGTYGTAISLGFSVILSTELPLGKAIQRLRSLAREAFSNRIRHILS